MPVYEYWCQDCRMTFEKLVPLSSNGSSVTCPRCHRQASKQFSTFATPGVKAPTATGGCCGGGGGCACVG